MRVREVKTIFSLLLTYFTMTMSVIKQSRIVSYNATYAKEHNFNLRTSLKSSVRTVAPLDLNQNQHILVENSMNHFPFNPVKTWFSVADSNTGILSYSRGNNIGIFICCRERSIVSILFRTSFCS